MRPLTARDIMHPDLLDENGQLIDRPTLSSSPLTVEAVRAAVQKMRNQRYVLPMGSGLPGPYPYTSCMWSSGGRWCSNMATHRGKETCEHEHIFTIFACDEHQSLCMLLVGDYAHTCQTKLHDVERLADG